MKNSMALANTEPGEDPCQGKGDNRVMVHDNLRERHLCPTQKYCEHWQYPFSHFNPVQTAVLPYRDKDVNVVIGANTSAGKTVCAEMLMDYTLAMGRTLKGRKNRVIYLSPLKSLTQEKYDEWLKRFPRHKITILTGDYTLSEQKKREIANSSILVMTSEMADSRTRRMSTENNFWLREVGLVIVDESHIISTDRGHAVESGLMRFSRINPWARVLLLSATMPNCRELAEWLTELNGKRSHVIYSKWRPVRLEMRYIEHQVMGDYKRTQESKRSMAVAIALGAHQYSLGKGEEKYLVFCHDKTTGRDIVKRLTKAGVPAQFHNADLEMGARLETERLFNRRKGGIRVLVSTSTLAWGRNLPARNVVIVGVHRGIQDVDELDIIQMAGRAGRLGLDPAGTVFLICPQGTEAKWQHTFQNPRPVHSGFMDNNPNRIGKKIRLPVLAFHLLAEIEGKTVSSLGDIMEWFKRSLAHYQDPGCFTEEDAKRLLDDLKRMNMIEFKGEYVSPYITGLGKVSAWLYYSPYDIYAWYNNFNKYLGTYGADDMLLCWALGDVPSNDWGYVPRDLQSQWNKWSWSLRQHGINASNAVCSSIAAFNCLGGQSPEGTLAQLMRSVRFDIRRISQAIWLIDSMFAKWDKKELWNSLPQRITYGISEDMVELVKIDGIGGVKAKRLYRRGIRGLADLAAQGNQHIVRQVARPDQARAWMMQARNLV